MTAEVFTADEAMALLLADDHQPLRRAERFVRSIAGWEIKVAVGLARLGHHALSGRVGADAAGGWVPDALQARFGLASTSISERRSAVVSSDRVRMMVHAFNDHPGRVAARSVTVVSAPTQEPAHASGPACLLTVKYCDAAVSGYVPAKGLSRTRRGGGRRRRCIGATGHR